MSQSDHRPPQLRVVDIVAGTLRAYGVQHAFGVPGGEVLTLVDALRAAGIRFVLNRHETPAASMAAGVSIMAGVPGLLVTTVGPGLANAVNAMVDATQERVPLIVLSGVVDHDIRHRYTHQVLDQAALVKAVVKASFEIERVGVGATMTRAIEMALAPPMGPVHVDLSPGTAALAAADGDRPGRPAQQVLAANFEGGSELGKLAALLAASKRPLVIAGFEAVRRGAASAVEALCARLGAPLITTYKAKGLIDERHPLCLGGAGLSPLADGVLLELVRASDVVLLIEYNPIEMRQVWLDPFGPRQMVVEICRHPYDHAMHRTDIRIIGVADGIIRALVAMAPEGDHRWPEQEPAMARTRLKNLFAAKEAWGPHAVFETLEETLADEAMFTVDSGAHRILLSQKMKIRRPLGLLQSAGFCTMGVALPLAAGAKIAAPERPAVAVVGDGGLEMGLGELATLRDERIPITIVVLQDESLALIELKQKAMNYEPAAVTLGLTPFEAIARAYGGHGERVADVASLAQALESAVKRGTFSVIVCPIQASQYFKRI